MDPQHLEVALSPQRLRELMLWHGKDEDNLPPAATLANLSRDTVAALREVQGLRAQLSELRSVLAQLFWSCDSSAIRRRVLAALGAPPEGDSVAPAAPAVEWAASPNGQPPPQLSDSWRAQPPQHATA